MEQERREKRLRNEIEREERAKAVYQDKGYSLGAEILASNVEDDRRTAAARQLFIDQHKKD